MDVPHTVHHPPDIRACIFWLRNCRPQQWRERTAPKQDEQPDWPMLEEASGRRAPPTSANAWMPYPSGHPKRTS